MARKATRKLVDVYKTTCGTCGEVLKYRATATTGPQSVIVAHFQSNHPDRKAQCYDVAGQTWDSQYDVCLKALHNTTAQRDQMQKERDAAAAQQRTLAAKLNAIVLVLRNDA